MKKAIIKYSVIVLLLLLPAMQAMAQKKGKNNKPEPDSIAAKNQHAAIKVFAKAYGDSIVLRWAPDDKWAWTALNATGYIIKRLEVTGGKTAAEELLTPQPLKVLTLEQMKATLPHDNKYAAIAAQCLYGKDFTFNTRKQGAGAIKDQSDIWEARFAFSLQVADLDAQTAVAEGLRFTDKNISKGAEYVYVVYPAGILQGGQVDTGYAFIKDIPRRTLKPKMGEVIPGDRVAELHWTRMQPEIYSGYFIERSADGKQFIQMNKNLFFSSLPDAEAMSKKDSTHKDIYNMMVLNHAYVDSLPEDHHKYYYRIRGVNAFAEWSNYSDTMYVVGLDLTAPSPPELDKPKYVHGRTITLHWSKKVRERDFNGYMVMRAHHKPTGQFEWISGKLLDTTATTFTDTAAFEHGGSFYRIAAVDTAGNMGYSGIAMGMVPDTTPPAPPTGLAGSIDRSGRVYLHWAKNAEEDMKGYKVYFANSSEHVYSQITIKPDTATTFTDTITLKTLTKNIWYKVVAVDQNNNHSGYSAPVELKKPDIVPPVAPLTSSVFVDTGGVKISFIKSASRDAAFYIIYRKQQDDTTWMPITQIKHDSTQTYFRYADNTVKPFVTYNYCAETVDEDSLHSPKSATVTAILKTVIPLPPLQTLQAAFDKKAQAVNLQWKYEDQGDYYFVLYRASGTDALTPYQTIAHGDSEFPDTTLPTGVNNMRYAIQIVYKDKRGKTRVSDPVSVKIPVN